jgi:hypothetical protein
MRLSGVALGFAVLSATASFAGSNESGAKAERSWADEVSEGVRDSRPPPAPGAREGRNPKLETEEERARSSKPVRPR